MSNDVIADVLTALAKGSDSASLKQLGRDLARHRMSIEARLQAICSKRDAHGLPLGSERRQAAEACDFGRLEAMTAEESRCNAELESCGALSAKLTFACNAALKAEALTGIPTGYLTFEAAVTELEGINKKRDAARQKVAAVVDAIRTHRMHLNGQCVDPASVDMLQRYLAAVGITHHEVYGFGRDAPHVAMVAAALGQDGPGRADHRHEAA